MFKNGTDKNNNNEKVSQDYTNSNNIIGKGSTFEGNVETYGNLRVEGKIIGDVRCKSKVAVGQSAYIDGKVMAQVAEVEGEVKGSIEVSDTLTLKPNCTIHGDIIANKLIVEAGAKFEGKCNMGKATKKIEFDKDNNVTENKASSDDKNKPPLSKTASMN